MRLGTVRFRHLSAVVKVTFSPDGKMLASAASDGVRLWEASTGKQLRHFRGGSGISNHPWFGGTLTFSPDGKTIALARNWLYVWDIASGKEIQHAKLRPEAQQFSSFLSVHFTTGGQILAASSSERAFQLLDAISGKVLMRVDNHGQVNFICLSPDGRTLVANERSNQGQHTVHFWEVATGKERRPAEALGWFQSAVFAPDGKSLAIAADGLCLLEWPSGKKLRTWKGHSGALAFSPDGKTLAVGSNQTVNLWNTATGDKLHSFPCFQWIQSLAFSSDGKTLAVGSGSFMHRLHPVDDQCGGVIHLWDTATGQRKGPQEAHQDVVTCVAFAPDGRTLVSGSRDRTVRFWETATGKQTGVLADHEGEVLAVAFGAKGKLLATAGRDKTVLLWDAVTRKRLHELKHDNDVYGLAFSPDGALLATAACSTARLWDTKTGQELRQWKGGKFGAVYAVAFSADGKTLAFAGGQRVFLPDSGDNEVRLVDPLGGKEKGQLPTRNGDFAVCTLAFSPDGEFLASGQMNPYLHLWQPATGKLLHKIETPAAGTVMFSPNGKSLAACSPFDSTIHLFEPVKGRELRKIHSPQGAVYAVAFSPNSRSLASAGQDGTILIWNL
jgi:WD40 repeat protein